MLDFGLYDEHAGLLNLPWLQQLQRGDKRQLQAGFSQPRSAAPPPSGARASDAALRSRQVAVANMILEFDKKNTADAVTRTKLEQLIWEAPHERLKKRTAPDPPPRRCMGLLPRPRTSFSSTRASPRTRGRTSCSGSSTATRPTRSTCCCARSTCRSARSTSRSRWTTTRCAATASSAP